ncbi:TIGR01777 family oxidoreductase [Alteribacter populi]|uniref:TIGR01777 family oxidoreductase n=1 Tax=Alteribacter populi TaxID=2011011 RepID=UPI000BBAC00A|nr:TIGR01777 family oxidoreductase [Alteribacter populi]
MESKGTVILAGGSGFLGKSLANYLISQDYEAVILTRSTGKEQNGIRYVQWDGRSLGQWQKELEGAAAVVNFTGKSVNCIYTKTNRKQIINSRIDSVNVLHEAMKACDRLPEVFIQAGSLAIFGDTKEVCDEGSQHGSGFSVEVCQRWEEVFYAEPVLSARKVLFRIGFVLGKDGGALDPLKKLTKAGLGGTVGKGDQYISWLHIDDLNRMILEAIVNSKVIGTYNATSPEPVQNRDFMMLLRQTMGRPWSPPAPRPAVIFGAYTVMRTEPSLALTGRRCIPKRLLEEGFTFNHTDLRTTLEKLLLK